MLREAYGKVLLDDDVAPADPVLMQNICSGRIQSEDYTDSKGRFRLLVQTTLAKSTEGGCKIRAVWPGFESDVVPLASAFNSISDDVGTIGMHRVLTGRGGTTSSTSLKASKEARKALEEGLRAERKADLENARRHLEKAVELDPAYAVAWLELGACHERQNNLEAARKAYLRAVDADANFILSYQRLAFLSAGANKWDEVVDYTDRLVKLNPRDFPEAYYNRGMAHLKLRQWSEAEKDMLILRELDPETRLAEVEMLHGEILVQKGDLAGAIEKMRRYLELAPNSPSAPAAGNRIADLERQAKEAPPGRK